VFPCLVIGDSLAVGVGHYLPECLTEAKVGISSQKFITELLTPQEADRVVISLGVNDAPTTHTVANLRRVRAAVSGKLVFWLLPAGHPAARAAIRSVAMTHGDRLIDTAPEAGADGLHPSGAGYHALAIAMTDAPGP
jgi:lysophospholipase L1-like esterase